MDEIWKDIVGYEGLYQISSYGRVKSLGRNVSKTIETAAKIYQEEKGKINCH